MDVAWDSCWGESQSTKPCVFPCKVDAAGDHGQLVCAALYTEITQGFVLRLPPQHKPHATFTQHNSFCSNKYTSMQPLQCDLQPQIQNILALRTHDETSIAKHNQGTNHTPKWTDCTRRTHEVPFTTRRGHFTRKNTRFRAPASLPKKQCNMNAAVTMSFAALRTHSCSHNLVTTQLPKVTLP